MNTQEIFSLISTALKTTESISAKIKNHKEQKLFNDLLSQLSQIQLFAIKIVEKNAELEEIIRNGNNWEIEKDKYSIKDIGAGQLVYVNKGFQNDGIKPQYFCANCFDNGKISVLGLIELTILKMYSCPICKNKFSAHQH
jgi:hypothetical protein